MIRTHIIFDVFAASRLILSCTNATALDYAIRVFVQIQDHNLFIFNVLIRAFSSSENPNQSFHFYIQSHRRGLNPDNLTFPFLVKSCTKLGSQFMGMQTHNHVIKHGFESDVYVLNSLLHMYATFGDINAAKVIFWKTHYFDVVSWTSMIMGFHKCGDFESARHLFDEMPQKNLVTWSVMINGCARNNCLDEAIELFRVLQLEGVRANEIVMVSVISSCAHLGALEEGKRAHEYVMRNNLTLNLILGTAIVDMYARCGDIGNAIRVFDDLLERDALSWTALISGLAMHGHAKRALEYFIEMTKVGINPRDITFTAVLSACSHGGLVEKGFEIFKSMKRDYAIEPRLEHYGCMVDLLGRAGKLEEAEKFVLEMPVKPNPAIWGALLGACRIHRNSRVGERVGKILIPLIPEHSGYYVLLSNIYARANDWKNAVEIRRTMKEKGIRKPPGYSLIEVDGQVFKFTIGDKSHPQIEMIEKMWEEIAGKIRKVGYAVSTDDVLFDVEDEEKESAIYRHSEKLAITFGIMRTKDRTSIRIVKNLRVCEDCHTATKLISEVFERDLIVRDRNRFHHFRKGVCSCRDYW